MLGFVAQYVFQQAVFLQSAVMKNGLLLQAVFVSKEVSFFTFTPHPRFSSF
jgi:hypothetical protein